MKVKLYSVRDTLVGNYLPLVQCDSDAKMIRDFGDLVNKGNTPISDHPEDYVLEFVGEFDVITGEITDCPCRVLAHASDFVKKESK